MANKFYYKKIKTMDSEFKKGRAGTPYYHNTPSSQELFKAAKFAKDWCKNIDILFEDHPATLVWYISAWDPIRRDARAGKGTKRTPKEAIAELLDLMTKGMPSWINHADYGMPGPCWDKWNAVIQHGFKLIAKNDFDYAEAMKVEFVQTQDGKKPLNNIKDLLESD